MITALHSPRGWAAACGKSRGRQGLFGRRNRENRQGEQREQSRRALFEELAKRPPNICPFLGLATSQTEYHDAVTREHRCYAFGEAADLSVEQQERVCLTRGYGNCPRYLRGVLVIPTEELDALRRPPQPVRPQPVRPPTPPLPPPRPPRPAAASSGGGRRLPLLIGLVLLLVVGGATGAFLLLRGPAAAGPTPTPIPTSQPTATATATAAASASVPASVAPASQTPFPQTPKPDATPVPGDVFVGYEVTVLEGENTLFQVDDSGTVTGSSIAHYARFSKAPVARVQAPNGVLHWRTSEGFFTGLSYIHGDSGPFLIREVYRGTDGSLRYTILPDSQT
jgi:hypothetical protein